MLPIHVIEDRLARAELDWRISRLVARTATIASILLAWFLALAILATCGLMASLSFAVLSAVLGFVVAGSCWCVMTLVTLLAPIDRPQLAMVLEQAEPRLLDRVNTMVHLDKALAKDSPLLKGISQQSAMVLTSPGAKRPFLLRSAAKPLVILMALGLIAATYFSYFRPLDRLRQAELAAAEQRQAEEAQQGLVIPEETWQEELAVATPEEPWTEIRIRDPGQDIRATRFDLIPIVVEAYSTKPLGEITLTIHIRGREPETIVLPQSDDPHYALQEYELDLLAMDIADWDVISYFAETSASTGPVDIPPQAEGANSTESALRAPGEPLEPDDGSITSPPSTVEKSLTDIYFVDVLPTREELESLPGGNSGETYRALQELTDLLRRQQDVVRDQHRDPAQSDWQLTELPADEAFAECQSELARSTRQLADRLPAQRDTLHQLAEWFERAKEIAQPQDREAMCEHAGRGLNQLASARQEVARQAMEQPQQFATTPPDSPDTQPMQSEPGPSQEGSDGPMDELTATQDGPKMPGEPTPSSDGDSNEFPEPSPEEIAGELTGEQDQLRDQGDEAWRRASRQLESLKRRQESSPGLDPEHERQMRDDAVAQLSEAISKLPGQNRSGDEILSQIQQELEQPREVLDWGLVRDLVRQIHDQRHVNEGRSLTDAEVAELTNVESSRFPPNYRKSIERYFQNLSESP